MKSDILELAFLLVADEPLPTDTTDEERWEALLLANRIRCPDCGD